MNSTRVFVFVMVGFLLSACAATGRDDSVQGAIEQGSRTMDLYREGMKAYTEGNMEVAENKLSQLVERVPEDSQVWFRLGNIYARTNRPRQAVQAYQDALVRDPSLAKAWHNMGVVRLRQAVNDFVSLAKSVPADDPLHSRGMKISNTLLALLNELPENESVEVDINLDDSDNADAAARENADREQTGPAQGR